MAHLQQKLGMGENDCISRLCLRDLIRVSRLVLAQHELQGKWQYRVCKFQLNILQRPGQQLHEFEPAKTGSNNLSFDGDFKPIDHRIFRRGEEQVQTDVQTAGQAELDVGAGHVLGVDPGHSLRLAVQPRQLPVSLAGSTHQAVLFDLQHQGHQRLLGKIH